MLKPLSHIFFVVVVTLCCQTLSLLPLQASNLKIDDLRNILNNPALSAGLTPNQRNFIDASLGMMLRTEGLGGAESDSLIHKAWITELSFPREQQNYLTFKLIALNHMITLDRNALAEATRMEKQCFHLAPDFNSVDYVSQRHFLATAYSISGDREALRRIVAEDISRLGNLSAENINPSSELLQYLWQCSKALNIENSKDNSAILACFSLIVNLTQRHLQIVGPQKIELNLVTQLMSAITKPLLAKFMDQKTILSIYDQMEEMIQQRTLSDTDRDTYSIFLSEKSTYLSMLEDYDKAEKCALKALDFATNSYNQLRGYASLLTISLKQKDLEKISEYFSKVKELGNITGEGTLTLQLTDCQMQYLDYLKANNSAGAIGCGERFLNIMRHEWDTHLPFMTTADRDNFIARHGDPALLLISCLQIWPEEAAAKTYDAILYRTGLQLRAQKEFSRAIVNSRNPNVKMLSDSLSIMRENLRLMDPFEKRAPFLEMNIRDMEYRLVDMVSPELKDVTDIPDWKQVRDCLKTDEAAIEMVFSTNQIIALIVKADSKQPIAVRLTGIEAFSGYMGRMLRPSTAAMAKKLYAAGNSDLYAMLWEPMEPILDNIRKIYLSAPGALNGISFNALVTNKGEMLFDKYNIQQVTTTASVTNMKGLKAPKNALLVGDVDFSGTDAARHDTTSGDTDREIAIDDFSERGMIRQHFRHLAFSKVEIDTVKKIFSKKDVRTICGKEATETNLRNALADKTPELLHLATHGFFISNVEDAMKVPFMQQHAGTISSSMQRAGVALANAEQAWRGSHLPDQADGILTALEVSDMDLRGMKLVVLSACETALGNYTFEGVYGLPRGFKQAGVESLLVSLWSVSDKATSLFMTEFYSQWISGKKRHDAYRMAIERVRRDFPAPFQWAPFILLD